eukprot:6469808-Amphidinium_carterae.1
MSCRESVLLDSLEGDLVRVRTRCSNALWCRNEARIRLFPSLVSACALGACAISIYGLLHCGVMAATTSSVSTPQSKTSKKIETGTKVKRAAVAPRTVDKRDSLAEAVRKAIHDNFKGWSREALTTIKRNDMSITERLLSDKKKWMATGSPTMGKLYYRALKAEYGGNPEKASGVFVVDTNESVSDKLRAAMVKAKQHVSDRSALLAFVECASSLTHREFVGILRVFEDLQPSASSIQRQLALEVTRMIARLSLKEKWGGEVTAMLPKIEEVLVE